MRANISSLTHQNTFVLRSFVPLFNYTVQMTPQQALPKDWKTPERLRAYTDGLQTLSNITETPERKKGQITHIKLTFFYQLCNRV